jgi:uncharacterized membrane protein YjgN (DUF898 family)
LKEAPEADFTATKATNAITRARVALALSLLFSICLPFSATRGYCRYCTSIESDNGPRFPFQITSQSSDLPSFASALAAAK